jgi:hypothetical protein
VRTPAPDAYGGELELGSKDGQLFFKTAREELVLLPSVRLDTTGRSLMTPDKYTSGSTVAIDKLRVQLAGWVTSKVYFDLGADFQPGFSARHVDEYVEVAPWGDRVMFELGQFDAPFTLENRTAERYLDFSDRGAAVRAFAIPENKDQGLMVHGINPGRNFYYSAAVLNGEGPGVSGVNNHFDYMARGWFAPFSFRDPDLLHEITLGGSFWTGDRSSGPAYPGQVTQGGFSVLEPSLWWWSGATRPLALREEGRLTSVALELNVPIANRFGFRFEWIGKHQGLAALDVSSSSPVTVSRVTLSGWASYAEIWAWVLGSDQLLAVAATPGLELPLRYRDLDAARARHGLMFAARVDHIDETLTGNGDVMPPTGVGIASGGATQLTAVTAGGTYWYTRRARLSVNYVFNHLTGQTPYLAGLGDHNEHEVIGRLVLGL